MRKRLEVKSGDKYGKLTIVKEIEPYISPSGKTQRKFNCLCECGNKKDVLLDNLRRDITTSCGCNYKGINKTHGLYNHPLYDTWNSMKQRCYNLKHKAYKDYGSRGIKVCDRWLNSLENFINGCGKPLSL